MKQYLVLVHDDGEWQSTIHSVAKAALLYAGSHPRYLGPFEMDAVGMLDGDGSIFDEAEILTITHAVANAVAHFK